MPAGPQRRRRGLRLIHGAPRSLGGARDAAISAASGEWLCFFDDDVILPPHYFHALDRKIRHNPEACVIGGPNLTPPQSPLFERRVGHVLGSWLCAGPMSRRYAGFKRDAWTGESGVILCNLCIRREALAHDGPRFDEGLVRNEENLLLERLSRRGRRILHAPELFVYHERRDIPQPSIRACSRARAAAALAANLVLGLGTPQVLELLAPLPLAASAFRRARCAARALAAARCGRFLLARDPAANARALEEFLCAPCVSRS